MLHTIPYTSWKHIAHILDVAVLKAFPNKEKDEMKIIDVAAGTGLTGVELNKLGYTNIDALDMSQEMLNEAKKKNVYKRFICAPLTDQRTFEIETGAYDALVCVNAIGNKHIIPSAMAEMCRFVSKGKELSFNFFLTVSYQRSFHGVPVKRGIAIFLSTVKIQGHWSVQFVNALPPPSPSPPAFPKKPSIRSFVS